MKHLGDITKIKNAPFVDCITFGSPCQDLSIAGKRVGLAGERSGLFMESVRIIKEMREQSGGLYPTFAVWENVPGAFSSNSGEDFRTVLEELARIKEPGVSIPRPENGKWAKAGFITGNGWSLAWRTFDAQFWGVPQRRRRIAVVVDFGGQRAGEILFERTGLSGHLEPSIPPWKGVARNPAHSPAGHDRAVGRKEPVTYPGVCITSKQNASNPKPGDPCHTLNTDSQNYVCVLQGNMIDRDAKQNGSGIAESKTMFTLNATDRHGVCSAAFTASAGAKANGIGYAEEQALTLRTDGDLNAMPTVIVNAPYQNNTGPLMANSHPGSYCGQDAYTDMFVTCQEVYDARGNGDGKICPTLTGDHENRVTDYTAVVAEPTVLESNQVHATITNTGVCPTLSASMGMGGGYVPMITRKISFSSSGFGAYNESIGTLRASGGDNGGGSENIIAEKRLRWIVRRLTPTECERLQGFPDGWTDIGEWYDSTTGKGYWLDTKGKKHKTADSPRYKALGNSIALPQWWWITFKMAAYLPEHATLGSLFDGIGGFPLVWETRHGKGTAVWASEIEEFPIAVTKEHFKNEH